MRRLRITDGSLMGVARRARSLAAAGAAAPEAWSLAQICRHLALSIEATLVNSRVTIGGSGGFGPLPRWLFRRITLTLGYIPRGVPVPDGVHPGEQVSTDAAVAHLECAARAFEAAATEQDRAWPGQRFMGPLCAAQWRRFHHVHAAHHFARLVPSCQDM